MYMCSECGAVYEELPTITEKIGYYGSEPQYETYEVDECSCGGWLKETAKCKRCGEQKIEADFEDDFCKDCYSEIYSINNIPANSKVILTLPDAQKCLEIESNIAEKQEFRRITTTSATISLDSAYTVYF